jgi:hypothetical protein
MGECEISEHKKMIIMIGMQHHTLHNLRVHHAEKIIKKKFNHLSIYRTVAQPFSRGR